jgi:DNA modification methylase
LLTCRLIHGETPAMLKGLESESVQMCCTSPPYWGLRSYLPDGHDDKASEIGLEGTPEEYVARLVAVFREVRRVLKPDGTLWLNLGDSYNSAGDIGRHDNREGRRPDGNDFDIKDRGTKRQFRPAFAGLKPKDLVGIPWMVAFALRADGWWLRQDIIWAKNNPMPESVTDRCTKAHEYVFLLSKRASYRCDMDAIREPASMKPQRRAVAHVGHEAPGQAPHNGFAAARDEPARDYDDRNKRSVWTVNPKPFTGWEGISHPCRVGEGVLSYGMTHRVSADCPHHACLAPPATSGEHGGHGANPPASRTGSTPAHPVQGLLDGFGTASQPPEPTTQQQSSGSPPPSCSPSATPRSKRSRRTDPAPSTSPPCTPCDQTPAGTAGTGEARGTGAPSPSSPESSTGSGATPCNASTGTEPGTADIPVSGAVVGASIRSLNEMGCTCSFYTVSTKKIDHFAVMPEALVEPCVLAGCPEGGTVLDPFAGSGTVPAVALRLGRHAVGIDLNREYLRLAEARCREAGEALGLFDPFVVSVESTEGASQR